MWATSDGPRLEDFGITEDDLARAPRLLFSQHRIAIFVVMYLLAAVISFTLIFETTNSWPAAAFFTVITLAAASILLLPAIVLVICAGERAEEHWLCLRFPTFRACLAYQRALAGHNRLAAIPNGHPLTPVNWASASLPKSVSHVISELERLSIGRISPVDREGTGVDLIVDSAKGRVLVRCEPGPQPVTASVGRELAAALGDLSGDAAAILSVGGATEALGLYIADRPITLVGPDRVEDVLQTGNELQATR